MNFLEEIAVRMKIRLAQIDLAQDAGRLTAIATAVGSGLGKALTQDEVLVNVSFDSYVELATACGWLEPRLDTMLKVFSRHCTSRAFLEAPDLGRQYELSNGSALVLKMKASATRPEGTP